MLTHQAKDSLSEMLRGERRTYNAADSSGMSREEFEALWQKLADHLPVKRLNYDEILDNDPIASDPQIIQGKVTILRLDEVYQLAHTLFFSDWREGTRKTKTKDINTPEDFNNPKYTDGHLNHSGTPKTGSHTVEHSQTSGAAGARYLDLAIKAAVQSYRVQISVTKRQEKLEKILNNNSQDTQESSHHPNAHYPNPQRKRGAATARPHDPNNLSEITAHTAIPSLEKSSLEKDATSNDPQSPPHSAPPHKTETKPNPQPRHYCKSQHPQYTRPLAEGEKPWTYFDPDLLRAEDEPETYPLYTKPPFPGEKNHLYPPFSAVTSEEAKELETYLASLSPEITADKTIGMGPRNEYLTTPLRQHTDNEQEFVTRQSRQNKTEPLANLRAHPPVQSPCPNSVGHVAPATDALPQARHFSGTEETFKLNNCVALAQPPPNTS